MARRSGPGSTPPATVGARAVDARAVDARIVRTRNDICRATLDVLFDEGRDAVTQVHVAEVAGYSKATVYKHWPTKVDLLRDALTRLGDIEHHTPAGNLRNDLVKELTVFRRGMENQRLDRALAVLAELIVSVPELADVRDKLVTDGEQAIRRMLAPFLSDTELEAATLMLCGAILHAALMHGKLPSDQIIAATVDIALRGIDVTTSTP